MEKIPTAEEVIDKMVKFASVNDTINCTVYSLSQVMIEFARMHVEAALKQASEKATWKYESFDTYFGDSRNFDFIDTDGAGDPSTGHNVFVDKDSILNSYPLTNIK